MKVEPDHLELIRKSEFLVCGVADMTSLDEIRKNLTSLVAAEFEGGVCLSHR